MSCIVVTTETLAGSTRVHRVRPDHQMRDAINATWQYLKSRCGEVHCFLHKQEDQQASGEGALCIIDALDWVHAGEQLGPDLPGTRQALKTFKRTGGTIEKCEYLFCCSGTHSYTKLQ